MSVVLLNTGEVKVALIKIPTNFCYLWTRASEGKTVEVPYRGPVDATILDILGGLRSACTYMGAAKLKELPRRATFIRVSQQINNIFGACD